MSKQKFKVGQVVWGFVFGRLVTAEITNVFEGGVEVSFTDFLVDFDTVSVELAGKDCELYSTAEEAKKARGKAYENSH